MEREYELDQAETISLLSAPTLTVSTFWNIKIQMQQMGKCIVANKRPRVGYKSCHWKIWSENYYETSLAIIRTRFWNTIWFENKTLRVGDKGRGNCICLEIGLGFHQFWLHENYFLPETFGIGLGSTHLYLISKSWQWIFCCRWHIWFLF